MLMEGPQENNEYNFENNHDVPLNYLNQHIILIGIINTGKLSDTKFILRK